MNVHHIPRRKRNRSIKSLLPNRNLPPSPPPPPSGITVTGCFSDTTNSVEWDFSDTITYLGGGVPQLEVGDGMGGFLQPTMIVQADTTILYATYAGTVGYAGVRPWRLLTPPDNIAESADISVPESGTYS